MPYKGGGQAIGDVIGGHVDDDHGRRCRSARAWSRAARSRALAVTSPKRSPAMPNVPTHRRGRRQAADVDLRFWFASSGRRAFLARSRPRSQKAVATVMADPKVRERLAKLDIEPDFVPGAGHAYEARERDQELDHVHRREGHQGGMTRRRKERGARPVASAPRGIVGLRARALKTSPANARGSAAGRARPGR